MPNVDLCESKKSGELAPHTEVTVECGLAKGHETQENGHPWHVAWQTISPGFEIMFRWKA